MHIQREIQDLLTHSDFDVSNRKIICKDMLISSPQAGRLNMQVYIKYKTAIAILYRAYLVSVEKNIHESKIKRLNTILDESVYRLQSTGQDPLTLKILKDLFMIVKKPLNVDGNNDVEIIFSEEISNVIKNHALVS